MPASSRSEPMSVGALFDPRGYRPFLDFRLGRAGEIYAEETERLSLRWENGRLDEINVGSSSGVGHRVLTGGRNTFVAVDARRPVTEGLSEEEARVLSRALGAASRTPFRGPSLVPVPLQRSPLLKPPTAESLPQKIARLAAVEKAARAVGRLRQVTLTHNEVTKKIGIVDFSGRVSAEERTYVTFVVHVTAEKGGQVQTGYEVAAGVGGLEILDRARLPRLARLAARRALSKLDAPASPAGEGTAVISCSAGGTMVHEAVGHALEADSIQDGSSPHFAGKIGRVLANEKITILDDPTLPGFRGSFRFDDEGTPAESTVLVERGVLKTYLYDVKTARRDKRASNGHGRRESYAFKPIPRMSNTFIAPGPDDPAQILHELKKGLFVTRMGGGQVNTTSGDFVFEVEEGFWVENGRILHPVRGASLLGNTAEVLASIDRVGWDMGWSVGTCGKEGQGAPVSDGLPTLRVPRVVFGGTA